MSACFSLSVVNSAKNHAIPKTGWQTRVFDAETFFEAVSSVSTAISHSSKEGNKADEFRVIVADLGKGAYSASKHNPILRGALCCSMGGGGTKFRFVWVLAEALASHKPYEFLCNAIAANLAQFGAKIVEAPCVVAETDFGTLSISGELLSSSVLEDLGLWEGFEDSPAEEQPIPMDNKYLNGQVREAAYNAFFGICNWLAYKPEDEEFQPFFKELSLYGVSAFGARAVHEVFSVTLPKYFTPDGDYDEEKFWSCWGSAVGLVDWAEQKKVSKKPRFLTNLSEHLRFFNDGVAELMTEWKIAIRRWDEVRKVGVLPAIPEHETYSVSCRFLVEAEGVFKGIVSPYIKRGVKPHTDKRVFSVVNSEFPQNDNQMVVVIASPMHTAKSVMIRRFREANKNLRFLFVSPRISLCAKDTLALNATPYRDIVRVKNPDKNCFTTVLNSMTVQRVMEWNPEVVVLDEVVQILEDMMQSGTMNLQERGEVLRAMTYALGHARIVIASDADANHRVMAMIKAMTPNVNNKFAFIENTYRVQRGKKIELPSREHLLAQILTSATADKKEGKTTQVYCSSKNEAEVVAKVAKSRNEELRILLVTADTSGEDDVSVYLSSPDSQMNKWDLVVASPTITSGISIETENVGDIFLCGMVGSIGTRHMRQQVCRARKAKKLYWFCENQTVSPYRAEEALYGDMLDGFISVQQEYMAHVSLPLGTKDLFARLYAATLCDVLVDHANMRDKFSYMSTVDGWEKAVAEDMDVRDMEAAAVREEKKEQKQILKKEKIQRVVQAESLTQEQFIALSKKDRLTRPQASSLEKERIRRFYQTEVTSEIVEKDNESRFRRVVLLCEELTRSQQDEQVVDVTALFFNNQVPSFMERQRRKEVYLHLTKLAGFCPISLEKTLRYSSETDWVKKIHEEVKNSYNFKRDLQISLGVVFRETEKAISVVNAIFRALGVETKTRNGDREAAEGTVRGRRVYEADNSYLRKVMRLRRQKLRSVPVALVFNKERMEQLKERRVVLPSVIASIEEWAKENAKFYEKAPEGEDYDTIILDFSGEIDED